MFNDNELAYISLAVIAYLAAGGLDSETVIRVTNIKNKITTLLGTNIDSTTRDSAAT